MRPRLCYAWQKCAVQILSKADQGPLHWTKLGNISIHKRLLAIQASPVWHPQNAVMTIAGAQTMSWDLRFTKEFTNDHSANRQIFLEQKSEHFHQTSIQFAIKGFETFECKFEPFECKFEPLECKFEPLECKFEPLERDSKHSNPNSKWFWKAYWFLWTWWYHAEEVGHKKLGFWGFVRLEWG